MSGVQLSIGAEMEAWRSSNNRGGSVVIKQQQGWKHVVIKQQQGWKRGDQATTGVEAW